jgi:tetratricopeptide (TPR) repeat protein
MSRSNAFDRPIALAFLFVCFCSLSHAEVRIWEEDLVLPTYRVRADDKNPMFQRPLSYQGATRAIYPYPLQDNFTNEREDVAYRAVYLENAYIKLCVLPEMGGRLFYATDKTNGYEIFYRQHVIKPAHIGMLGAWISGGIEWCVFHHHRASTFMPVDYRLAENPDGSKTLWFGEIEPRHRMKWTIGISLYPGRSWVEARIKLINRTDTVNSMLFWANVATHVNDDYQVIFPPSTDYAVYHSKVDFVHWPLARSRYRGVDYQGVDLSWWKNHPKPVSFFAHDLQEGFLAGIDHGKRAGTMYVANHHVAPGAKLWEWGPGDEGRMWDCVVLTEKDGPYAELMAGAYSDNQPDYSWIKPGEMKQAVQTWYPLRDMGHVKSGNREGAVNLEVDKDGQVQLAFNTTSHVKQARIELRTGEKVLLDKEIEISPARPFRAAVPLPEGVWETDLRARLIDAHGRELVGYHPVKKEVPEGLPPTVTSPPAPEKIATIEELYFTGLRIKQFHNARLDPMDYFRAALKRDPNDSRCNIQAGLDAAGRGRYEQAATHFERAVARVTRNYTRPRDCEAFYQLGLVRQRMGQLDRAYEALYRAAWDSAFRAPAYRELAQIDCRRGDFARALEHLDQSLAVNAQDIKVLGLRSAVLRRLNRMEEARDSIDRALELDPLDHLAHHERVRLCLHQPETSAILDARRKLTAILRDHAESYVELAADYMGAGLWEDMAAILEGAIDRKVDGLSDYPTVHYYLAYACDKQGRNERAAAALQRAAQCPTDYCFPFRLESLDVYDFALKHNPRDSRAWLYRGNLLYDRQPEQAMAAWRRAVDCEPSLAQAHRNLGWGATYGEPEDLGAAITHYERAIACDSSDPRLYIELDKLYERQGTSTSKRLALMEAHPEVVRRHEAALFRRIVILIQAEHYDTAVAALTENFFHAAEERRGLHEVHVDAHLLRGLQRFDAGDIAAALDDFRAADTYPENHQIGRARSEPRNAAIYTLIGLCQRRLGQDAEARTAFERALVDKAEGDWYAYYRGVAQRELGQVEAAASTFTRLIEDGEERLGRSEEVNVFAKFGEGDPLHVRRARAHTLMGLGYLGRGDRPAARAALAKAVSLDVNNLWARYFLEREVGL